MKNIKLFPLSAPILPNGMMKLRIFEPRYKRLVTESCKNEQGFGICLLDKDSSQEMPSNVSQYGTLVEIVDFCLEDDGMLGITVHGTQRFMISSVAIEEDGLRNAQVLMLENWQPSELQFSEGYISDKLQAVYQQFPEIQTLYPQCYFDDASWVSQRWLELLPLKPILFDSIMQQQDCRAAVEFLTQAIEH